MLNQTQLSLALIEKKMMIYLHKEDKFKHTSCIGKPDGYDKLVKAIQGYEKQSKYTCLSATIV